MIKSIGFGEVEDGEGRRASATNLSGQRQWQA